MNKKRLLSITAIILAFSFFAAFNFEASHAGHESTCHEEDCPICLVLQIIRSIDKISSSNSTLPSEFINFSYINILIFSALLLAPSTLVKQKVKLVI